MRAEAAPQKSPLAEHFASLEVQEHAARFGMWLFLATELLLFAGLFCAYTIYRYLYPEAFTEASRHLDLVMGTINTVVLITSSLTVAIAYHFAKVGRKKLVFLFLLASVLMAFLFLGIKAVEYSHKFHEGALPGKYYTYEGVTGQGASMFFTVYFLSTGLHAFHVVAGMGVLGWIALRAWRGEFTPQWHTPVELAGLYWHVVDLFWIFLFPLLYLI